MPQPDRERRLHDESKDDQRHAFERDRDRVLYSSAFRRLAGVTQVVDTAQGHVFHNRLTHSMKVGQLGRRLAQMVEQRHPDEAKQLGVHQEVVEAAALAHDLGHPPFGHVAEEELDDAVRKAHDDGPSDGYEGNPQSFRIVTRLSTRDVDAVGLNLTRATLNALLKYPYFREAEGDRSSKWGAYHSEATEFAFAREGVPASTGKSAEARLMEYADDIAYSVHDVEDFYRAGWLPLDRLLRDHVVRADFLEETKDAWSNKIGSNEAQQALEGFANYAHSELHRPYDGSHLQRGALRAWTSFMVSRLVMAVKIEESSDGLCVTMEDHARHTVVVLKSLMRRYVFENPLLASQQHGQRRLVRSLFDCYCDATHGNKAKNILPPKFRDILAVELARCSNSGDQDRVCCRVAADIVASMTEAEAFATFRRLHGHDPGLIQSLMLA